MPYHVSVICTRLQHTWSYSCEAVSLGPHVRLRPGPKSSGHVLRVVAVLLVEMLMHFAYLCLWSESSCCVCWQVKVQLAPGLPTGISCTVHGLARRCAKGEQSLHQEDWKRKKALASRAPPRPLGA